MARQDSGFGGSEVMYPTVVNSQNDQHPLVPAYEVVGGMPPMYGPSGHRGPEILHGPLNQTWLVNSLRRRWLSAVLLGALSAILAGFLLWWLFPLSSQVVSYLQVSMEEPESILNDQARKMTTVQDYGYFQGTQVVLMKGQFVLNSALNRNDVRQTNAIQKEMPNELQWLTDELTVAFGAESEILMVKYEGEEDPEEMKLIINAVVDAYRNEVLASSRVKKIANHTSMETLHTEVRKELSDKIGRLQVLSKELGGAETPNASAELNMIIRDIGMIDQRMYTVKEQLNNLEVEFQLRSRDAQSPTALREAVNAELENDPTLKGYGADKYAIEQQIRQFKIISKQATSPQTKQLQQQLVLLIQQEAEYRARLEQEITNRLKSVPNDAMQLIMTEYLMRRQQAQQSLTDLQTERDQKIEEMEALNQENGELVMLKANVEQLQEIERQMDYKIRSWKVVDESADDRVKVIQEASVMDSVNRFERYGIVSLGSLAAFCLTCYGVALVEFTRRKLNSPADVDEGLGIRVLGVLPPVSGRKGMAPGSLLAAQLAESIDNVRATLMHDSTSRPRQIVLVASPSSMEGSTTVASHLALSLTRAGRRTLLIDGDLRDPALHKLFGMPLEDGVSELLRSEIEVADAIRPTNTEGLWLMTAGVCDMDAIHALATSQLQPVFEKLRTEFDFVIIDGAPVLGLTDSLSIGQHIDGAILTVLRDHSGVREIHQASELLKSLGIRVIGSVVNGMPFKADRRVARMQNLSASRTKRLPAVKEE